MRLVSTILSVILLCSLLFCSMPFALADEKATEPAVDYENYDWVSLNFSNMDRKTWDPMRAWLLTSADIDTIFLVASKAVNYYKKDISSVISARLILQPNAVIYALAQEDESDWKYYCEFIVLENYEWEAMVDFLGSIVLTGPKAEKGYEILAYMIDYGNEFHNPKTGDPVSVFIVLLAISGLFGGILITQRKRFTA